MDGDKQERRCVKRWMGAFRFSFANIIWDKRIDTDRKLLWQPTNQSENICSLHSCEQLIICNNVFQLIPILHLFSIICDPRVILAFYLRSMARHPYLPTSILLSSLRETRIKDDNAVWEFDQDDVILMTRRGRRNPTEARAKVQGSRILQRKGRRQEGEGRERRL